MKYFTFFPGFIVAALFILLLTLNTAFNWKIPLIKDIRQPIIALLIAGFLMCAFGTLADSMTNILREGRIDWLVIAMISTGILILVVGGIGIFSKTPAFGLLTKNWSYFILLALIIVKTALSTVRVLKLK